MQVEDPDGWDPEQYERFKAQRSAPFHDLLSLLRPVPGGTLVDLGCGTGELTRLAHERLGARETTGLDNSESMLTRAAACAGGGVRFERRDVAAFGTSGEEVDIVLSNATLQWLANHEAVLTNWAFALRDGGQLAVQVPANADHPSHVTAVEVAESAEFAADFPEGPPPDPVRSVLAPEAYAALLARLGFADQHVRLQVYGHWLESTGDVVEWVKGTSLTRFKRVLPADRYEALLARYTERLRDRLGDTRPFFYPFKRILIWGCK